MKVIVTGSTGFVGRALVQECIQNPRIEHAFVLTRRPIADETVTKSAKITVILHSDFASYPPDLLAQLQGAQGCLWQVAIGGRATHFPSLAEAKTVQVDFALAAAQAFSQSLATADGPPFRFVFCSGKYAEWDQAKSLSFMQDTRRLKGLVEKGLCDLADAHSDSLQVWCVRPSGIVPAQPGLLTRAIGSLYAAIGVDHIAAAMAKILLDGWDARLVENEALLSFGKPKSSS